jgi:hypothetical protein
MTASNGISNKDAQKTRMNGKNMSGYFDFSLSKEMFFSLSEDGR